MKVVGRSPDSFIFEGTELDFALMLGFAGVDNYEFSRAKSKLSESKEDFNINTGFVKSKKEAQVHRFLQGVSKRDLEKMKEKIENAIEITDKIQLFETIKDVAEEGDKK